MGINQKAIELIKKYQKNKPGTFSGRCVHFPTCSTYGIECYQKFNFLKASFLTAKRILFCTPLNKKFYDPVPLTKDEKKLDNILNEEAKKIIPYLIDHYKKYSNSLATDFIKLIYQATFGPKHLNTPTTEKVKQYLNEEIKLLPNNKLESIEDISNDYVRIHLGKDSNLDSIANMFIKSCEKKLTEYSETIFYKRINILTKLIKTKKIKINKKEALNIIQEYIINGIHPISHSDTYKKFYEPHYRVISKEYLKR